MDLFIDQVKLLCDIIKFFLTKRNHHDKIIHDLLSF